MEQFESVDNSNEKNKDFTKEELNHSPEELKLIKRIEKIFARNKKFREKYDEKWMDFYKIFRGMQWKEERPHYRHSEVINFVFSAIQSVVPIMTDSRPKFEYLANEPTDFRFAEIMNRISEYDWIRNNWLMVIVEALYESHIFGTGISSLTWDGQADYGLGGMKFKTCDTFHFYPSPKVSNIQDDREFIYAYPMQIREIKRLWPSKAKFIKPDIGTEKFDRTNYSVHTHLSPIDDVIYEKENSKDYDLDEALVIHAYLRDDEELESIEKKEFERRETDNGLLEQVEQTKYEHKRKYPRGRWVVLCNKVLLQDGHLPYEDGKWPFSKVLNYVMPHEFWGESEVAQLEGPQRTFNKLVSFCLDVLTLMGNPIVVMDTNTGVDPDTIWNEPGQIIIKNPGSEFRREEGVQLQPYVIQIIDRMKSWIDNISGASDVTKGISSPNLSGYAIEQITEAAQTRIRQKSRNLDAMLQDVGQMYVARAQQFYSVPRMMRITNSEDVTEYFKVEFQQHDDGSMLKYTPYVKNEEGEYQEGPVELLPISGLLDVRVITGTLLPFNKAVKENRLFSMYRDGIIDREEVLKGTDHPNWEKVLERMDQKDQQAAQQQAMKQAQ